MQSQRQSQRHHGAKMMQNLFIQESKLFSYLPVFIQHQNLNEFGYMREKKRLSPQNFTVWSRIRWADLREEAEILVDALALVVPPVEMHAVGTGRRSVRRAGPSAHSAEANLLAGKVPVSSQTGAVCRVAQGGKV